MSNPPPPARPPHRREVCACPFLLALRAQLNCFCGMGSCLRCTAMVVVVPAGARRRQARKARPGRRGPCGGRAAHHAIVAMCDTADSLTWRVLERLFMRWATFTWSHSVWSPSAVHVSSAVCGKSSSSAEPWRGNWPQSFDGRSRSLASEEIRRRSVRHKVRRA